MSFDLIEAKLLAESWENVEIKEYFILAWGNEFIRRIVDNRAWEEDTEDYDDSVADTWYSLPSDFFRSVGVEDSNEDPYENYIIKNGRIAFAGDDSYVLTYVAYPAELTDIESSVVEGVMINNVPLAESFLYPLAEFFLFRSYTDNPDKRQEYEQRFRISLKNIYDNMELTEGCFQTIVRW